MLGVEGVDRRGTEDRGARRDETLIARLDGVDVGVTVSQADTLQAVERVVLGRTAVRRGEEHPRRAVSVVLQDLVGEQADAHDGGHLPCFRRWRADEERRRLLVARREAGQLQSLADAVPELLGGVLVDCDLVGPLRVRPPAARRREAILVEEPAVERPNRLEVFQEDGLAVHDDDHIEGHPRPRLDDLREPGRLRLDGLVVQRAARHRERRGVGRPQEPRI